MVQDDPLCAAARRDDKIVVTGLWVDHSFDVGIPVDPTSVSFYCTPYFYYVAGSDLLRKYFFLCSRITF